MSHVFNTAGENYIKDILLLISAVESDDQPSCIKGYMDQTVLESSKIKENDGLETKLQPEEQEPVRAGNFCNSQQYKLAMISHFLFIRDIVEYCACKKKA